MYIVNTELLRSSYETLSLETLDTDAAWAKVYNLSHFDDNEN